MDYCANTFRRELISRDGAQTISRQSHTLSTRDHGNDSNGEPPLKPGTNTYDQFNSNVLLRPVEYAVGMWVLARYGRSPMMRFAAGAVAAATVIVVPFLVAAPGRMFSDVVGFQTGRPRSDTGLGERVFFFTGSLIGYERIPNLGWLVVGIGGVAAAALPLIHAARCRVPAPRWDEPV